MRIVAEVGQAGLRAHRGELGTIDRDLELALGARIRESLERRVLDIAKIHSTLRKSRSHVD